VSEPEQTDSDAVDADATREAETPTALSSAQESVVERLAEYDAVLEVGIGRRPGVARTLVSRNVNVQAVDVYDQSVPDCIDFVQDDVVERAARLEETLHTEQVGENAPTASFRVDAIYALNLPPELQQPALQIARSVDAAFLFTTLGGDPATVPTRTEPVGYDCLYVAREG
jgi:uncharacterized UPF0146 family protein